MVLGEADIKDLAIIRTFPTGYTVSYMTNGKEEISLHKFGTEPRSLSKNFMDGVRASYSKYIVRIDGDDEQSEYFLEYGIELAKSREMAISPVYLINDTWRLVDMPQGAGIFYEREKFLNVGGYDETLDFQADLDFYIRYTNQFPMSIEPSLVYLWKASGGRSANNKDAILKFRREILDRHKLKEDEVHHFGGYAYI